ncbi:UpxY family transcription antiterminator [uncultured Parabacteroides sp.]|uniref:UpxY family transcription antiterminator n=1 Tax=uncultured Parabacteroides sp. TaxID=512312 RepID=UPI002615A06E|nr:UpxY family transcription antiterminator [uncultured Parabacteroides sp.]
MSVSKNNSAIGNSDKQWYVMRDLSRSNAKLPAYKMLREMGIRFFTPMVWRIVSVRGRRERKEVPFMQDLVFVCDSREVVDPIVENVRTFQYRYLRGREPMTVRNKDMERFIRAVESTESPRYYRPEEVTADICSRQIRIIGGNLNGYEGFLITTRGSKTKRLLVSLPSLLAASIEVEAEYIQLI